MTDLLKVQALSVRYAGALRPSIADVSFSLAAGEVVGVVGESGSGKTTLGLALLGLLPQGTKVHGSALFERAEILGVSERELRPLRGTLLSTIVQNPATALNPSFSVGSQIVALLRRHRTLSKSGARSLAIEWLDRVGISEPEKRMGSYSHQLSGGMNQRVVIAMALALSPRLVIADEPTSALDVTVQAAILRLITELIDDSGSSMVLITHDLGVVAQMCSRVIVMKDGAVVEAGEVDQIFHAPRSDYTQHLLASQPSHSAPAKPMPTVSASEAAVAKSTEEHGHG
ncbi:ABC transporter ATP-binding protein [Cryobacterium sp. Hb1]|uniref:ABC transporter ATP-binding protein n=1 Tax=Cryobacterium sp. Hb1 TaxID=1259147 RepID=UPI00106AF150|nr:ABC transporter ATP-binding protein [Cryobacterium sp. Hb1]TFD70468.1 ABC transporter ATP-binding protein [Cryobacterium sp. Hb1]